MNTTATHDWKYENFVNHADRLSSYIDDICFENKTNDEMVAALLLNWISESSPEAGLTKMPKILERFINNFPGTPSQIYAMRSAIEDKMVALWEEWSEGVNMPEREIALEVIWYTILPLLEERINEEYLRDDSWDR